MLICVGITNSDLGSLDHASIRVASASSFRLAAMRSSPGCETFLQGRQMSDQVFETLCSPGQVAELRATASGLLCLDISGKKIELPAATRWIAIETASQTSSLRIPGLKRPSASGVQGPQYKGTLVLHPRAGKVRCSLILDLDDYLRGVLQSEIPASYEMEAIKTQAVAARTYGLHPRLSHKADFSNVCDSYLCCQYFSGVVANTDPRHAKAIEQTAGQILVYQGAPALALFSSCAGGHTESYHFAFSDPITGQFPPATIPYLTGVSESAPRQSTTSHVDEKYMRALYHNGVPQTKDSWSHHFKWSVKALKNDIESYLHANAKRLLSDPESTGFVKPPESGKFGEVRAFHAAARGAAGTIVNLRVETSQGDWTFSKELIIRDFFKMPSLKVSRLKSARIFFDQSRDSRGYLNQVTIFGLGWGHGVGMQQTGAQGWAKHGLNYRDILSHYFRGTEITKV